MHRVMQRGCPTRPSSTARSRRQSRAEASLPRPVRTGRTRLLAPLPPSVVHLLSCFLASSRPLVHTTRLLPLRHLSKHHSSRPVSREAHRSLRSARAGCSRLLTPRPPPSMHVSSRFLAPSRLLMHTTRPLPLRRSSLQYSWRTRSRCTASALSPRSRTPRPPSRCSPTIDASMGTSAGPLRVRSYPHDPPPRSSTLPTSPAALHVSSIPRVDDVIAPP